MERQFSLTNQALEATMSTILNAANRYNGKLSSAAISTFAGIAASIEQAANTPLFDKINPHMMEAFLEAKAEAKNKREFVKLAKAKTGLLKNDDKFITACIERWYS
jgi:uncharacterized protein YccT (UPF0319 family)